MWASFANTENRWNAGNDGRRSFNQDFVFGHFVESIGDAFPSKSGVLDSTIGHGVEAEARRIIDDEAADIKVFEEGLDAVAIFSEKCGMDSVLRGVDPIDSIFIG